MLATATAATAATALVALLALVEVPAAPPAQALFDENVLIPKASASLLAKAASAFDKSLSDIFLKGTRFTIRKEYIFSKMIGY